MVLRDSETPKIVLNRLLGPVLARPGAVLANLTLSGDCRGPVLACLDPVLNLSWPSLGLSWPVSGLSRACLEPVCACLGLSWADLGMSWPYLEPILACLACVLVYFWTLCYYFCQNNCWPSPSAFRLHIAARRYVRSTSAASRRESRACQTSPQVFA